jgi:hypothetical protein
MDQQDTAVIMDQQDTAVSMDQQDTALIMDKQVSKESKKPKALFHNYLPINQGR